MAVTCTVEGCDKPQRCKGLCGRHYKRLTVHGDPLAGKDRPRGSAEERFWAKVDKNGPHPDPEECFRPVDGPCWLWTDRPDTRGYGNLWLNPDATKAHRFSFALVNGTIPDGLDPDHLCRVKLCVNPAHLELVTPEENIRREWLFRERQPTCPHGHLFTPENTKKGSRGERRCVTCERERRKLRYERSGR